ncbi:hypothetical protein [Methylogaea oryzae]|nr:hypothetical protein [Methylogaea oryzae]
MDFNWSIKSSGMAGGIPQEQVRIDGADGVRGSGKIQADCGDPPRLSLD